MEGPMNHMDNVTQNNEHYLMTNDVMGSNERFESFGRQPHVISIINL